MRKFLEEHELEVLLILITMIAVTRWWIPPAIGFENIYCVSHWVLSYDHGLVRRGLIGSVFGLWMPTVTVENVRIAALVTYCTFLALLVVVFYVLLKTKDESRRLFRLILLFLATPATLSLFARDLGRFDLFLVIIMLVSFILISVNRHLWLVPVLMFIAMFIHEAFIILCAPTIAAGMFFVYRWKKDKRYLATLVLSMISVAGAFLVLYKFGTPALGYEDFSRLIQSRASFYITELSMRECFYSINDHVALASPYLRDAGSIVNFLGALLILSPVILVLLNLWTHAFRNCGARRGSIRLFSLATLSGLMVVPIATDYGRWLAAVVFCNFFAIFFLVKMDIIRTEELAEYSGGAVPLMFAALVLMYLLFGPLHDWNPYPYQHHLVYSALSITLALLFDIAFSLRWWSLSRVTGYDRKRPIA